MAPKVANWPFKSIGILFSALGEKSGPKVID